MRALLALALVCGATPAVSEVIDTTYACERGVRVPVLYITTADPALAVLQVEGRMVALRQVSSGSGFFYADTDEQRGYRWRGQGDRARLAFLAADHTAKEQVLLAECVVGSDAP